MFNEHTEVDMICEIGAADFKKEFERAMKGLCQNRNIIDIKMHVPTEDETHFTAIIIHNPKEPTNG